MQEFRKGGGRACYCRMFAKLSLNVAPPLKNKKKRGGGINPHMHILLIILSDD